MNKLLIFILSIIGAFAVFILIRYKRHAGTIEQVLEVKSSYWQHTQYIESYKTFTEEKWADSMPPDAVKISSRIIPKGTNVFLYVETITEKERYQINTPSPVPTRPPTRPTYAEREVIKKRNVFGSLPEDREMIKYQIKRWEEDASKTIISKGDETQQPILNQSRFDSITTRPGRHTTFYSLYLETTIGEQKIYSA